MRLVLDSGAVTSLARQRSRLDALRRRGAWPPEVPAVVLTEILTGDHGRNHSTSRFLRTCVVRVVDEPLARSAARVRAATGRAGSISVVDALVAALAESVADAVVLTSDPGDLAALADVAQRRFRVVGL